MPPTEEFPEASKVDCRDDEETYFCKIYSGHPSDSTFLGERDVDYIEADVAEDLHSIPSRTLDAEHLRYPSEIGHVIFEVPEEHGCAFADERLTCGPWLG